MYTTGYKMNKLPIQTQFQPHPANEDAGKVLASKPLPLPTASFGSDLQLHLCIIAPLSILS
jgi:hypothetical protein